ncbi:MBL fold metallo-hydrolase [Corynebacterium sp. H128]|uniref:MBL fold metallo-hydrolase n=1 Tax=unclassified Corynebacterium TaxID=2624378 RepID=UPI0030991A1F
MKLTILGCSGSTASPANPPSGYLVQVDNAPGVLMDIGPGVLAKLQELADPSDLHVVLSHLHADHCLDLPSLIVWRRYHPASPAKSRHLLLGPADTTGHLGPLNLEGADDLSDTFAFTPWTARTPQIVDRVQITPFPAIHPVETYSLRVTEATSGKVIAYSADSAYTDSLVECARDADLFLCEATWGYESAGKAPDMHLSGSEAGLIASRAGAKKLVLVHIPPWGDAAGALRGAQENFDGEVVIGESGMVFEF